MGKDKWKVGTTYECKGVFVHGILGKVYRMWTNGKEARITLVHASEENEAYDVPPPTEQATSIWLSSAAVTVLLLLGNFIMFSLASYGLYDLVKR